MNREAKFRAWDEVQQVMIYDGDTWAPQEQRARSCVVQKVKVCSRFIVYPYSAPLAKYVRVFEKDGCGADYYSNWDYDKFFSKSLLFMERLGIKDIKEVDIYEDDIVRGLWQVDKQTVVTGLVKYYEEYALWAVEDDGGKILSVVWDGCEIVGNVHV